MSTAFLDTAIALAREGGSFLRTSFAEELVVEAKGRFDVVTAVDRQVETWLVRQLRAAFPSHAVVGEESGFHGPGTDVRLKADATYEDVWYIDPLDGTKNFTRRNPAFSISLALVRHGEVVAGVVFDPMRDELFAAERGGGACRNGVPMRVSHVPRVEQCLVTSGFPSARRHPDARPERGHAVLMATQGLRRSGSSALDLAYVACGRIDAFWDIGLSAWDILAGVLLVAEAGGRVSHIDGAAFTVSGPDLIATNGLVHGNLLALLDSQYVESGSSRIPDPLRLKPEPTYPDGERSC